MHYFVIGGQGVNACAPAESSLSDDELIELIRGVLDALDGAAP